MNFPNIGLKISKISKSQVFQDLSLGIENFNPKISKFHLLLTETDNKNLAKNTKTGLINTCLGNKQFE